MRLIAIFLFLLPVFFIPLTISGEIIQLHGGNDFGMLGASMSAPGVFDRKSAGRHSFFADEIDGDFTLLCVFENKKKSLGRRLGVLGRSKTETGFYFGEYTLLFSPLRYESTDGPDMKSRIILMREDSVLSKTDAKGLDSLTEDMKVRVSRRGSELTVEAGYGNMNTFLNTPIVSSPLYQAGLITGNDGDTRLKYLSLALDDNRNNREKICEMSPEEMSGYFARSTDPLEGFWQVFDREMDEALLRPGGIYTLAIVRSGDGYDIVYISGAQVNGEKWECGMRKGRLHTTDAESVYEATWIDSMFGVLSNEIRATYSAPTLTFMFPYQDSKIRLIKKKN